MYVVELCQKPDGVRFTEYREYPSGECHPEHALETVPATGSQFIEWGFYKYSEHLRLTTGERFSFDPHGIWLTESEIDYLQRTRKRTWPDNEPPPWVNGIAPLFAPS